MEQILKVSILVPIYNVEHFIEKCLRSLFEQSYEYIEYVFFNDCSLDSSMEILEKILLEYPCRKGYCRIINNSKRRG